MVSWRNIFFMQTYSHWMTPHLSLCMWSTMWSCVFRHFCGPMHQNTKLYSEPPIHPPAHSFNPPPNPLIIFNSTNALNQVLPLRLLERSRLRGHRGWVNPNRRSFLHWLTGSSSGLDLLENISSAQATEVCFASHIGRVFVFVVVVVKYGMISCIPYGHLPRHDDCKHTETCNLMSLSQLFCVLLFYDLLLNHSPSGSFSA